MNRGLLFFVAIAVLSACGSGGGATAISPVVQHSGLKASSATFNITVPTPPPPSAPNSSATHKRPDYVSYRVQSVVISGSGVDESGNSVMANVTPTSGSCSGTPTTCSITMAANVGNSEAFTVTAYDAANGTGNVLSTGSVSVPITAGTANVIGVVLNPIVAFGPIAPASNPSSVANVTAGPNGIYFFAGALYEFSPATQSYTTCESAIDFNTPIVSGSDGNVWVADSGAYIDTGSNNIDKVQISGSTCGSLTAYPIGSVAVISAMTVGSDSKIWFGTSSNEIGTVTTSGTVTNVSTADNPPSQMILGSDGNVWFTTTAGEIEKVTPAGVVTVVATGINAYSIASGSDGSVWYTTSSTIGKITPAGVTTTFPQANPVEGQGLTLGPDGELWFVNDLGLAEIATNGSVTTYTGWGTFSYSGSLAFGGDGNLYFGASADLDEFIR